MVYDRSPAPYARGRACWSQVCAALRGILAVLILLATAVDELVTARLGVPPVAPVVRQVAREIASEYRAGRMGAIDADVIDTNTDTERRR